MRVTTPKLEDGSVTGDKILNYKIPYQTDNANTISSITGTNIVMQMGWAQGVGNNTSAFSNAITFPTAFTTILGVNASLVGALSTGAAANIKGLTTAFDTTTFGVAAGAITETGFNAYLTRATGAFSTTTYYGFSWIAWGIV